MKFSGGSTPLQTLSNKEIVSGNSYLTSSSFPVNLKDQLKEFRWARHSKEAKEALALQQNLIDLAEDVIKMAFAAKEAKKKKSARQMVAQLLLTQLNCLKISPRNSFWQRPGT